MNPFEVVTQFEEELCEYTGAPHCVTVDSCTNALFLSLLYAKHTEGVKTVSVPSRTYVGVAQSVINAGHRLHFNPNHTWGGWYEMLPTPVVDSAKHFERNMYEELEIKLGYPPLVCLSFHIAKKLPLGRGGAILCQDGTTADWLRAAKQDGRTAGQRGTDSNMNLQQPGYHMYMPPAEAARGLWLLYALQHEEFDDYTAYPDISGLF